MGNFLDGAKDISCDGSSMLPSAKEVDITKQLDVPTKECLDSIIRHLGDVKLIRCTNKSLTEWCNGNVFMEIITDTQHDDHGSLYNIIESRFGISNDEPISLVASTSIDVDSTSVHSELSDRSEYYLLYRR